MRQEPKPPCGSRRNDGIGQDDRRQAGGRPGSGRGFADTDEEVESSEPASRCTRCSNQTWEETFRRSESEALEVHLLVPGGLGRRGGRRGAVLSKSNRQAMRREATVVWLRASVGTLTDRVGSGEGRPLLASDGSERDV